MTTWQAPADPLAEPETITFAGDWHGDTYWALRVIDAAAEDNSDVIVHLGDFGIWPGEKGQIYLDVLDRSLSEAGIPLLFVDGNHEDFPQLYRYPMLMNGLRQVRPWIYHLPRGFRWAWAGTTFLALGGATSLDKAYRVPGVSWWPEEALTAEDVEHAIQGGPVDVMITHDAPWGSPIPGLNDNMWNPAALREAHDHQKLLRTVVDAVRPSALYHGHFHRKYDGSVAGDDYTTSVHGLDCNNGYSVDSYMHVPLSDVKH